jgi:hypothetical protein
MNKNILNRFIIFAGLLLLLTDSAYASGGTLGEMMNRVVGGSTNIVNLVSFLAYITGTIFAAVGVYKLKQHVEFGPQKIELPEPLKYLFTGGLMLALPSIANVAYMTFGGTGAGQEINTLAWNSGASGSGGGLDDMMRNFIQDSYVPMQYLIQFFCVAAGAMLMMLAVHRFTKTAQEGPRGPTGLGTIATFVLAGALFSIAPSIGTFTETLFGDRTSRTIVSFMALDDSLGAASANAENVLTSVLAFLIIVGILSIIKGFFVMRDVAEGSQNATMLSGLSHVIAGAILVNFGQFANIVQNTLGISGYGVLFN